MKKKYILSAIYLLGWLYPLSILVFNIADYFLVIKEPRGCPFDFNNDAMIGWCFYGLLIGFVSFLIFFIASFVKFRMSKLFYLTLLNLPVIFFLIAYSWTYSFAESLSCNIAELAISLAVIVLSLLPLFKAEEKIR
ncbi:MAG: hypothetical protein E7538_09810 [Ruminococcaceae bacterium]|nr:hypothetical protein [Oscillospiraceae bacterium]